VAQRHRRDGSIPVWCLHLSRRLCVSPSFLLHWSSASSRNRQAPHGVIRRVGRADGVHGIRIAFAESEDPRHMGLDPTLGATSDRTGRRLVFRYLIPGAIFGFTWSTRNQRSPSGAYEKKDSCRAKRRHNPGWTEYRARALRLGFLSRISDDIGAVSRLSERISGGLSCGGGEWAWRRDCGRGAGDVWVRAIGHTTALTADGVWRPVASARSAMACSLAAGSTTVEHRDDDQRAHAAVRTPRRSPMMSVSVDRHRTTRDAPRQDLSGVEFLDALAPARSDAAVPRYTLWRADARGKRRRTHVLGGLIARARLRCPHGLTSGPPAVSALPRGHADRHRGAPTVVEPAAMSTPC